LQLKIRHGWPFKSKMLFASGENWLNPSNRIKKRAQDTSRQFLHNNIIEQKLTKSGPIRRPDKQSLYRSSKKSLLTNFQHGIDDNHYRRGTHVAEKITGDNIMASWTREMANVSQRSRLLILPRYSNSELNARHRIDVDSEVRAVRTPEGRSKGTISAVQ